MKNALLENMIVLESASIIKGLELIDLNAQGVVFVVDQTGLLVGVLTDGDVRRGLIQGASTKDPISTIMNRQFVFKNFKDPKNVIRDTLNSKIKYIPLVDERKHLVDYASYQKLHQIPIMEPFLEGNELKYVVDCVESKWISSQGAYVEKFEQAFSKLYYDYPALTVSNGTVALHLAMVALGIGPGDEVIVPNFTFAASINTIIHAGATPVIVDVDPKTWCISCNEIEKSITPRTKAIMPVHLYGEPCDMKAIMEIAKRHKLLVIEDVAEALGSFFGDRLAGSFGDASCFSFYGNKMITTGEGGMIVFRDKEIAKRARMLRDHGMRPERRYWHVEVGYNYRMTNIQAAIGLAQLERFQDICARKEQIVDRYFKLLADCPYIELPPKTPGTHSVYWLFTIRVKPDAGMSRDQLMEKLKLNNIDSRPAFYPLSDMPIYKEFAFQRPMDVSTSISNSAFSLPSSVTLTLDLVDHIAHTLIGILKLRNQFNADKSHSAECVVELQ